jgi:hypothetical protein
MIAAPATHAYIAFFLSVLGNHLVANAITIALSPLMIRSIKMIFNDARNNTMTDQ